MSEGSGLIRGLEGVVAAETQLCDLDGAHGRLAYRGYDIADLARQATFEEVVYLLWHGALPTRAQLKELTEQLAANREIPEQIVAAIRLYPNAKSKPPVNSMAALRAAVAQLGLYDPEAEELSPEALRRIAVRLTAQMPTIVAQGPVSLQLMPPPSASPLGQKRRASSSSTMATEFGAK